MPQGIGYGPGLESILAALAQGGQPTGQVGKELSPLSVTQLSQGLPQTQLGDPQLQLIMEALAREGAAGFNLGGPIVA